MPELDSSKSKAVSAHVSGSGAKLRLLAVVLAGVYSWALTVLPLALAQDLSTLAQLFSGVALLALVLSPFFAPGRVAIVLALDVFLAFCILTWWAGRTTPTESNLAIFGSFGWLAYTLALGALSSPHEKSLAVPQKAEHLRARRPASRRAAVAILVALGSSIYLLKAAWAVERPALSVLAHVFALTSALLVLRSGTGLATYFQAQGTSMALVPRLRAAMIPLACMILAIVAIAWGRHL